MQHETMKQTTTRECAQKQKICHMYVRLHFKMSHTLILVGVYLCPDLKFQGFASTQLPKLTTFFSKTEQR